MPKHQPAEIRRAQLFEAALDLCAEKGYHATRVDDVATRAGLSKGSLYHHFKSKEDLYQHLLKEMIHHVAVEITEAFEHEEGSWLEALKQVFDHFLEQMRKRPGLIVGLMEFYMLGLRKPQFQQLCLSYYEELQKALAPFISRAMEGGELRGDLDVQRFTWLLLTGGDGVLMVNVMLGKEPEGLELSLELMERLIASATGGQR